MTAGLYYYTNIVQMHLPTAKQGIFPVLYVIHLGNDDVLWVMVTDLFTVCEVERLIK